ENNTVAELGVATKALNNGKGADIVVSCGNNIDSTNGANMTIADKKTIDKTLLGITSDRYVALINENGITSYVYENCFNVTTEEVVQPE
ncbi:MAG: hypothetical protein IJ811_03825, partial [Clostridia bacterium]|nr:hypothetical protein [Clostridia bacterium]